MLSAEDQSPNLIPLVVGLFSGGGAFPEKKKLQSIFQMGVRSILQVALGDGISELKEIGGDNLPILLLLSPEQELIDLAITIKKSSESTIKAVVISGDEISNLPPEIDDLWVLPKQSLPELLLVKDHVIQAFIALRSQVQIFVGEIQEKERRIQGVTSVTETNPSQFAWQTAIRGRAWCTEREANLIYNKKWRPFVPPTRRLDSNEQGIVLEIGRQGVFCHTETKAAVDFVKLNLLALAVWNRNLKHKSAGKLNAVRALLEPFYSKDSLQPAFFPLVSLYSKFNQSYQNCFSLYSKVNCFLLGSGVDSKSTYLHKSPVIYSLRTLAGGAFSLAFFCAVFFTSYAKLYKIDEHHFAQSFWLSLFVFGILGSLICLLVNRIKQSKELSEDFLILREVMRVQFFWRMAGIEMIASDQFPRGMKSRLNRLKIAGANLALLTMTGKEMPKKSPEGKQLNFVLTNWIRQQRVRAIGELHEDVSTKKYNKSAQFAHEDHALHGVANGLFAWAITAAALHLFHFGYSKPGFDLLTLTCGLLLVCLIIGIGVIVVKYEQCYEWLTSHHGWHSIPLFTGFIAGAAVTICFTLLSIDVLDVKPISILLKTGGKYAEYWWIATSVLCGLLAGILHSRHQLQAPAIHAASLKSQGQTFMEAELALSDLLSSGEIDENTLQEVQRYLREIGHYSLAESARWVIDQRARPLTMPHVI